MVYELVESASDAFESTSFTVDVEALSRNELYGGEDSAVNYSSENFITEEQSN